MVLAIRIPFHFHLFLKQFLMNVVSVTSSPHTANQKRGLEFLWLWVLLLLSSLFLRFMFILCVWVGVGMGPMCVGTHGGKKKALDYTGVTGNCGLLNVDTEIQTCTFYTVDNYRVVLLTAELPLQPWFWLFETKSYRVYQTTLNFRSSCLYLPSPEVTNL